MDKELDISTDLVFLADNFRGQSEEDLLESLSMCTPLQTDKIMNHIDLLEDDMLIGYHRTEDRVFILMGEELIEITLNKNK